MNKRAFPWFLGFLLLLTAVSPVWAADDDDAPAKAAGARTTAFPSSEQPDQVCLTWSGDPATTQTVQWRTSTAIEKGVVQYRKKDAAESTAQDVDAPCVTLTDPAIANDPSVHRFETVLTGLNAGTEYAYRVGSGQADAWSGWAEFTTAPATAVPFSFIYMGDPQVKLDAWGVFLHQAYERFPGAAFYLIAGDLVNSGNERDNWDELLHAAQGVFDRRPIVPTTGNHEYSWSIVPKGYLDQFALPANGPECMQPEHSYSMRYGNALFLIMDSNMLVAQQRPWMEKQLAGTDATWKFVMHHQPVYSSAPVRDNKNIREGWATLYDQYHVDIVFQGHDHAYLRTPPMKADKAVTSPAEGTIYVVSNSGGKHYPQSPHEYAAVEFPNVSTYQVIDIETGNTDKLTYRAYDAEGKVRDEFVIEK
ncbi:MAG: hypothetical protein QG656_139 [Candidatus Hydrogenedentes bacterium]|nr:hypothetical protein [Candidatus Hydrogenedentota bacterium]